MKSIDTIVATATPPGRGGVAVVRLSGPSALTIACQLTHRQTLKPRFAHFASFFNRTQELIDQGILLYFPAPGSFTGEEVVELQVHGSPFVVDQLLKMCVLFGARLARPGEFSERAFLNDKMDLAQAEAVADLIHASSETAAKMAVRSLQGDFSKTIYQLNEQIISLRLFVEAAIDFPEEEIDFLNDGKIEKLLRQVLQDLSAILKAASQGALLLEGVSIVLAGRPNAGKSTLMNALTGRDVAIVTEIAGTTRDVMRQQALLDDIPVHFIDTAGLRESDDIVEQEGIKRAWQEVITADCIVMVVDIQNAKEEIASLQADLAAKLPNSVPVIMVYNKIDVAMVPAIRDANQVYLSAKSGDGLALLKEVIKESIGYQPVEGQFLARRRHIDALEEAQRLLQQALQQLVKRRAGELVAFDLRMAHQVLCEITGEFSSDDLLGRIFSSFCIGK